MSTTPSALSGLETRELIKAREITVRELRNIEAEIKARLPVAGGKPPTNLATRILACLKEYGDCSPGLIAAVIGCDPHPVNTALFRLKKSKRIVSAGRGIYSCDINNTKVA